MEILKNRILECAEVIDGKILKVDSFLNHQCDIGLYNRIGQEFKNRFAKSDITKILTIEASGIGIACITAQYFGVPVVFAKKGTASNFTGEIYKSKVYSFTKEKHYEIIVAKKVLSEQDRVLIIDDFLANGNAVRGLIDILGQAGAKPEGVGIVIEKMFQKGRHEIIKMGIRLESLAVIKSLEQGKIIFE